MQVGANDGVGNDFLYQFKSKIAKGILLEPRTDTYKQLEKNYSGNSTFHPYHAALDQTDGHRDIYKISFSNCRWATGLSSFNKQVLIKHFENGYVQKKAKEEGITIPDDKTKWIASESVRTISGQYLRLLRTDVCEGRAAFRRWFCHRLAGRVTNQCQSGGHIRPTLRCRRIKGRWRVCRQRKLDCSA